MGEPAGGTRPMGEPAPNAGYRGAIERLLRAIREAIVGEPAPNAGYCGAIERFIIYLD